LPESAGPARDVAVAPAGIGDDGPALILGFGVRQTDAGKHPGQQPEQATTGAPASHHSRELIEPPVLHAPSSRILVHPLPRV
jgi:hypothetical protein